MVGKNSEKPYLTYEKVYFFITEKCNFRCKHCFVDQAVRQNGNDLSARDIYEFMKEFVELKGQKPKIINIAGSGNPVLNRELPKILAVARKMTRKHVTINLRGKIPDKILDELVRHRVVVYYSIEYAGMKNDVHSGKDGLWQIQMQTVNELLGRGIPVNIRQTIMRDNFGDCLSMMRFVEEISSQSVETQIKDKNGKVRKMKIPIPLFWQGVPYIPYNEDDLARTPTDMQLTHITTTALSSKHCDVVAPYYIILNPGQRDKPKWLGKQRICEAGRPYGRICMKEDYGVYICPFDTEPVGYFKEEPLEEILKKVYDRSISAPLPEKCKNCPEYNMCKGGCVVSRYNVGKVICPIPMMEG